MPGHPPCTQNAVKLPTAFLHMPVLAALLVPLLLQALRDCCSCNVGEVCNHFLQPKLLLLLTLCSAFMGLTSSGLPPQQTSSFMG